VATNRVEGRTHGSRFRPSAVGTIATALLLLMAGCGGTDHEPSTAKTSSRSLAATSLQETCPKVRASLPRTMRPFAIWQRFGDRLDRLMVSGDAETKNALKPLRNAVDVLGAGPAPGQGAVDAEHKFIRALDHLAQRCAAAGSTALQP
jgi:hypothetical protein